MACIAVVTTLGSLDDARRIGRELVERRLAACAQIAPIESFYVWDGALCNDAEFRLLLKTTDARYAALEAALRARHPYELPAIHAERLGPVYPPYAAWIERMTSAEVSEPPADGA
jgi:periplasmic divalent cation tolerance protein